MTVMTFFGCFFMAYGPILSLFGGLVLREAPLVIVCLACALCQLLATLAASILWYIVTGLQTVPPWNVWYSVMFQEAFRGLLLLLLARAKTAFERFVGTRMSDVQQIKYALAGGIGFALTSSSLNYITLLVASLQPGMAPCTGCPGASMYFISAITTLLFTVLHVCWMPLAVDSLKRGRSNWRLPYVVLSHFGASYLTLLQVYPVYLGCVISLMLLFGLAGVTAALCARSFADRVRKTQ